MTPMSSARRRSMAAAIAFALVSSILALVAAPAGAEAFDTSSEPPTANEVPKVQEIAKNVPPATGWYRSEEHTSELQSLMRISYAVFCLKKKNSHTKITEIEKVEKQKDSKQDTQKA